jgi:hypothetical protein
MHMKVLHPDPRRPYAPGKRDGDDLKDRVVDLAREVLMAWDQVAEQDEMARFRSVMAQARRSAVADSRLSARRMGITPLFS